MRLEALKGKVRHELDKGGNISKPLLRAWLQETQQMSLGGKRLEENHNHCVFKLSLCFEFVTS